MHIVTCRKPIHLAIFGRYTLLTCCNFPSYAFVFIIWLRFPRYKTDECGNYMTFSHSPFFFSFFLFRFIVSMLSSFPLFCNCFLLLLSHSSSITFASLSSLIWPRSPFSLATASLTSFFLEARLSSSSHLPHDFLE